MVYIGTNVITGEEIAMKLESVKAKHPQLEYEAKVYKCLAGGGMILYYLLIFIFNLMYTL